MAYANGSSDPELRRVCLRVMGAIGAGQLAGRTSTAALEELWHLELRRRPPDLRGATADAYALFTPLLPVTDEIVRAALALPVTGIGANDRIHLATCRANGIDRIVSTDAEFDSTGELRRIDPRDDRAIAELLG